MWPLEKGQVCGAAAGLRGLSCRVFRGGLASRLGFRKGSLGWCPGDRQGDCWFGYVVSDDTRLNWCVRVRRSSMNPHPWPDLGRGVAVEKGKGGGHLPHRESLPVVSRWWLGTHGGGRCQGSPPGEDRRTSGEPQEPRNWGSRGGQGGTPQAHGMVDRTPGRVSGGSGQVRVCQSGSPARKGTLARRPQCGRFGSEASAIPRVLLPPPQPFLPKSLLF